METILKILSITLPYILELVKSKAVPALKRRAYEVFDRKADKLIEDLAQNASKIKDEENEAKKQAYIEGSKLGAETLKALGEKLIKAADEINTSLVGGAVRPANCGALKTIEGAA